MCCSEADQCSGVLTLEASCIFLVAMAVHTQTIRLCFQTSVLLYGVYTDKKGKGEAINLYPEAVADNFKVEVDECLPEGVICIHVFTIHVNKFKMMAVQRY